MNTPIRNRNPYNTLSLVFTSFYPTILFLNGSKWKCSCTVLLCYPAIEPRRGCSVSKRLVKLTSFKSFPLQLSGYQDISLLSFVRVASSTLIRCGWVFINARSVENCISVERLNTLNTDLQSVLQNIKKFAAG